MIDSFEVPSDIVMIDRSGIAWLDATGDVIPLCKDGKIVGHITVPGAEQCTIRSDKPGSVWVWTIAGLHHFTAAPGSPEYSLKGVYTVEAQGANVYRLMAEGDTGISPKGFVYTTTFDAANPGRKPRLLHMAALPAE
jgi:hypothetical protein